MQPRSDPGFARPMLDGEFYLTWARSLADGGGEPAGPFYLAPLYPHLLSGFLIVFGDRFAVLYCLQHLMVVASAALLASTGRRLIGSGAGIAAGALLLSYHPLLYFASRPVGEPLAILLMTAALAAASHLGSRASATAGVLTGLAGLARPNLLLVPVLWILAGVRRRSLRDAALLLFGSLLVVLPVSIRNLAVSGHPVLVSSNAGITLYQGNGPGARGPLLQLPELSGQLSSQREEATVIARARSGRDLDPVQADRWWAAQAAGARFEDPLGTLVLLARRIALLVSSREPGLDYAPAIDANPLRYSAIVPFGAILGLSVAGLYMLGTVGSGGRVIWSAVLACAVTPLVFYASSRYRLPLVAVLCVPAGGAIAALLNRETGLRGRRSIGIAIAAALFAASLLVPVDLSSIEASALANRASLWHRKANVAAAETDLRAALDRDPGSVPANYNLGVILEAAGRDDEAGESYRRALQRNPGHAESAGNLAALLVRAGRGQAAIPILRRALGVRPSNRVCWSNLVVAHASIGDRGAARQAALQARAAGVELDQTLLWKLAEDED